MKIGSIVFHCHDFDRTVAFWQAALHYVPRPRSRSWLHLDLYTADQKAEVERLVALGARRYPWRHRARDDFIVLEDPGGVLFCVVQQADLPRNQS